MIIKSKVNKNDAKDNKVIEAEVVPDGKKNKPEIKEDTDKTKNLKPAKKKSKFKYVLLLILIISIAVVFVFYQQTSKQNGQVELLNNIQQRVKSLTISNNKLVKHSKDQQKQINALIAKSNQNQIVDTQELEANIDIALDTLSGLGSKVASLAEKIQEQLGGDEEIANQFDDVVEGLIPTQGQQKKITDSLSIMRDKIKNLFKLNSSLEERQSQTRQQLDQPKTIVLAEPLTRTRLKAWIVDINTQWMVGADANKINSQLIALEQAVKISEFKDKVSLARLMGQDLNMLSQIDTSVNDDAREIFVEFREWLPSVLKASKKQMPKDETKSKADGFERLQEAFTDLLQITKTDDSTEMSSIKKILHHDVLVQRANLMLDRLSWAMNTESQVLYNDSLQNLKKFITKYGDVPNSQKNWLTESYLQLENVEFQVRQSLHVLSLP